MNTHKDIAAFMFWVRGRHPKIRPHMEDDLEWWNEGLALIEQGRFGLAGNKFQKLILSQPKHSDGYEGLARVYEKTGMCAEARMLMDHAIALASASVEKGETDQDVLDAMKGHRDRMPLGG